MQKESHFIQNTLVSNVLSVSCQNRLTSASPQPLLHSTATKLSWLKILSTAPSEATGLCTEQLIEAAKSSKATPAATKLSEHRLESLLQINQGTRKKKKKEWSKHVDFFSQSV